MDGPSLRRRPAAQIRTFGGQEDGSETPDSKTVNGEATGEAEATAKRKGGIKRAPPLGGRSKKAGADGPRMRRNLSLCEQMRVCECECEQQVKELKKTKNETVHGKGCPAACPKPLCQKNQTCGAPGNAGPVFDLAKDCICPVYDNLGRPIIPPNAACPYFPFACWYKNNQNCDAKEWDCVTKAERQDCYAQARDLCKGKSSNDPGLSATNYGFHDVDIRFSADPFPKRGLRKVRPLQVTESGTELCNEFGESAEEFARRDPQGYIRKQWEIYDREKCHRKCPIIEHYMKKRIPQWKAEELMRQDIEAKQKTSQPVPDHFKSTQVPEYSCAFPRFKPNADCSDDPTDLPNSNMDNERGYTWQGNDVKLSDGTILRCIEDTGPRFNPVLPGYLPMYCRPDRPLEAVYNGEKPLPAATREFPPVHCERIVEKGIPKTCLPFKLRKCKGCDEVLQENMNKLGIKNEAQRLETCRQLIEKQKMLECGRERGQCAAAGTDPPVVNAGYCGCLSDGGPCKDPYNMPSSNVADTVAQCKRPVTIEEDPCGLKLVTTCEKRGFLTSNDCTAMLKAYCAKQKPPNSDFQCDCSIPNEFVTVPGSDGCDEKILFSSGKTRCTRGNFTGLDEFVVGEGPLHMQPGFCRPGDVDSCSPGPNKNGPLSQYNHSKDGTTGSKVLYIRCPRVFPGIKDKPRPPKEAPTDAAPWYPSDEPIADPVHGEFPIADCKTVDTHMTLANRRAEETLVKQELLLRQKMEEERKKCIKELLVTDNKLEESKKRIAGQKNQWFCPVGYEKVDGPPEGMYAYPRPRRYDQMAKEVTHPTCASVMRDKQIMQFIQDERDKKKEREQRERICSIVENLKEERKCCKQRCRKPRASRGGKNRKTLKSSSAA